MPASEEQRVWLESAADVDAASGRSAAVEALYALGMMSVVALAAVLVALL